MELAQSFDQFLASVEQKAYVMALVSVKNEDDALDIVQDAMFTLVRKYNKKPPNEWAPLFYRILQNRINDFHRRNTVRNKVFSWFQRSDDTDADPVASFAAPPHYNPEQQQTFQDTASELEKALSELPPRQQQAFMLRAWEGLDVRETARCMGCSTGSVKTHYSRAVHALRQQLDDHYHG